MENGAPVGYLWAAILGIIQGLAEFLPVSSSGHLALAEHLGLGGPLPASFDVFLHLATLLAVLVYFKNAILWYLHNDARVLLYVFVATIPTGAIGIAAKTYFEALRHSPSMICAGFLVTACALSAAELGKNPGAPLRELGWFGAAVVGLCQALAIAPGISRSGMTISGAMICGVDREESFRFSFMLSVPAVAGAVFLHILQAYRHTGLSGLSPGGEIGPIAVAFVMAAGGGFLALTLLESLVRQGRLVWFAGYCCLAALAGFMHFNILNG